MIAARHPSACACSRRRRSSTRASSRPRPSTCSSCDGGSSSATCCRRRSASSTASRPSTSTYGDSVTEPGLPSSGRSSRRSDCGATTTSAPSWSARIGRGPRARWLPRRGAARPGARPRAAGTRRRAHRRARPGGARDRGPRARGLRRNGRGADIGRRVASRRARHPRDRRGGRAVRAPRALRDRRTSRSSRSSSRPAAASAPIAGTDRVLVVEAIRGIVERSTYQNLEFVVVADAETPDEVVVALEELCGDRLRPRAVGCPVQLQRAR